MRVPKAGSRPRRSGHAGQVMQAITLSLEPRMRQVGASAQPLRRPRHGLQRLCSARNPIRLVGLSGGVMSARIASNTTLNWRSYLASSSSSRRAKSR
jgi:hypothetical protein